MLVMDVAGATEALRNNVAKKLRTTPLEGRGIGFELAGVAESEVDNLVVLEVTSVSVGLPEVPVLRLISVTAAIIKSYRY